MLRVHKLWRPLWSCPKKSHRERRVRAAVRLHLAETYLAIGRLAAFHVSISGTQVLTNLRGRRKKNKAVIKQFTANASSMLI